LYQDNCGTPTATLKSSNVTGDNCAWTATYVYTIGDGCTGNSFDVTVTYTGGDTQSPTLKAGSSLPGGASGNLCKSNATAAPSAASIAALYQDNCGTVTATLKSSTVTGTDCNWTATYVYTISDGCVNNNFDVNVVYTGGDTESPVITSCPVDVTVECTAGSTTPANTGAATATDNCGSVTPTYVDAVSSVGCTKVITRTWTATDGCGHSATCVQKIIVRDRTAPVFNCVASGTPTVTDNCTAQANLIVYYKDNGNVRTWTAIDESGNIGTCQQTLSTFRINTASTNTQVASSTPVDPKDKKALSKLQAAQTSQVQVQAYPNPFKDQVQFVVTSPVSGKGSLDVYNALGQKIRTVFQGNIIKGTQNFSLHLSQRQVSNLVYVLRVGGQQVSGKILQVNQ
jgi:hypothetical protein